MAVVDLVISARSDEDGAGGHSKYVAECHRILEEAKIQHVLTPMSTVMEGDIDEIFNIVKIIQNRMYEIGAQRVYTIMRIDDRRDKPLTIKGKLKAVNDKLK
jgi:uncharacterized protein (TIGR00106 family)